jgi:hypothetical protein
MYKKALLFILLSLAISTAQASQSSKKENTEEEVAIEVLTEKPDKPYKILSPLSADKDSVDEAFKRLQQKAIDLKADAIMNLECHAGNKTRSGLLNLKTTGASSVCQGMAIKWKH